MDKVEVPKALHEILTNKINREIIAESLAGLIIDNFIDDLTWEDREEVCNWLDYDNIGAESLLAETEPEKEQLYYVRFADCIYLNKTRDKDICISDVSDMLFSDCEVCFTEREIKEIDERYRQFAVPAKGIGIE